MGTIARRQTTGRAGRALIALVVAALVLPGWLFSPAPAGAQGGSQVLIWPDGSDFAAFGGNETIEIGIGGFAYTTDCGPNGGLPDSMGLRAADIYIVPTGSVAPGTAAPLKDITDNPNTVSGTGSAFFDQVIGFARPQGSIPPGRYAIVYDECQNGVLDQYDAVFDPAFEVVIDPNVPPLPNNEMLAIKERAAAQALAWNEITNRMLMLFAVTDVLDAMGATNKVDALIFFMQAYGLTVFGQAGYTDPKDSAVANAINKVRQYNALANDPPDPDFADPVALGERASLDPQSADPLTLALIGVGNTAATEGAQVEALIHALERYQGTQAAGPGQHRGEWAAAHAHEAQTYATGLSAQLGDTDAALATLASALAADTRPIDGALAGLESRRVAIAAAGFGDDDLKALRALGVTDDQLGQVQTALGTANFATSKADLASSIATARGQIASTQAAFDNLGAAMTPIIATLAVAGTDDHPALSAGGPYSGIVGAPIAFTASATGAYPIVSYAWDLDADGDFDDATGPTPSHTYTEQFRGLVGLRATNAIGRVALAYAPLTVSGGNGRPQIAASAPTVGPAFVVGASQTFSLTVTDPESDSLTVQWTLDGAPVGTGLAYTLAATPYNLGLHTLVATASDGKPSGIDRRIWAVTILAPDADGDGWRANVDCDDNDPQAGYCPARPVPPDPANALTVTSTGDAAACPNGPGGAGYTLRCAIADANSAGAGKTIAFAIPSGDPGCDASAICTITPVDNGIVLPALTASNTVIDGYTQPGARPNTNGAGQGTNAIIKIHLQGNPTTTGFYAGLTINGSGNTVRGLSITGFDANKEPTVYSARQRGGIVINGNDNRISGNLIGLLPDGAAGALSYSGISIVDGHRNIIGGRTPADMNVLSNNRIYGIAIQYGGKAYPTGNVIAGNLIGTNLTGTAPLKNSVGVYQERAKRTVIGGTTPAERNVISGNQQYGLRMSDATGDGDDGGTTIVGNYIGVDVTGAVALGNGSSYPGSDGLYLSAISRVTITGNVISGNGTGPGEAGLRISGCRPWCRINGNRIGTNAAGTAAIPNSGDGLRLEGAGGTVVGGSAPGEGNLISGNGRNGIWLNAWGNRYAANDTRVIGNRIGTDLNGNGALGNGYFGVWIYSADAFVEHSVATIGGFGPGEANTIANNTLGGFGSGAVTPTYADTGWGSLGRDLVRGNIFRDNGGLGIDLQPGATVNCAEPTTDGPNGNLHCPVIRAVTASAVSGTGPAGATVDVYLVGAAGDPSGHGEATAYLGSATVHGCGDTWTLPGLALPNGAVVTATASLLDGPNRGTSEFAANVAVGTSNPLFAPTLTAAANQQAAVGVAGSFDLGTLGDACGLGPWNVAVNWGDGTANTTFQAAAVGALGTQAHTYASGGAKTVTVTSTNAAGASASAIFGVTIPTALPGVPQSVVATPGNASATVTWAAPAADGGSAIDRYDLSLAPTAGGTPQTQQVTLPATLTATFTGLTNGMEYTVSVTAHNANGDGPAATATVSLVALPATALAVGAASGTYGGATTLTATLTAASQPLAGKAVAFTLGGTPVGSATTDASGVATLQSISLAGIDAGSYPSGVAASFAGEANAYAGSVGSAALTVAQAPLTVTADDKSRLVGAANPAFTATYAGFVGGETTAALGGTLACTTTATIVSPVGTYPIACSGLTATNYALTYQPGTLTIAADGSATNADPVTVTYGAATATLTATVTASGAVNEGTVTFTLKQGSTVLGTATSGTVANGAASASLALAGLDAGAYTLVADYSGGPNVAASSGSGTLTIAKASQTITFGALADRQLGSGTFQVAATASSGLTVAFAASGACTVAGTTVTLTAVGTCTVTASQAGNTNYTAATAVVRGFQVTAAPSVQVTLTLSVAGSGTVLVTPPGTISGGGTFPFDPGTPVQLTPQPGEGAVFTGWVVDGTAKGWANPLTVTLDTAYAITATFKAAQTFTDVPANRADATAIVGLATRGTILGYGGGKYGPDEGVQRAQMAALIARAMPVGPGTPTNGMVACVSPGSWDCEDWGNGFTDRGGLIDSLWRNAGALQAHRVAVGYTRADCAAKGKAYPCFGPFDAVTYAETITFITRAMIEKGYWVAQPGAAQPYAGVPDVFAPYVATFYYYTQGAGGIPAVPNGNWSAQAQRGWFARALWAALDTYWGTDGTLPDNRNAGGFVP